MQAQLDLLHWIFLLTGGVITAVTMLFGGIMTFYLARIERQGTKAALLVATVAEKTEQVAVDTEDLRLKLENFLNGYTERNLQKSEDKWT